MTAHRHSGGRRSAAAEIAESVVARGGRVHIVGIEGEADPAIARFPHTWVNWGQIGRMVATLQRRGRAAAGDRRRRARPDLRRIRPDLGFFTEPAADPRACWPAATIPC